MKNSQTIRIVSQKDKEQWDTAATHPLASWEWGEFRKAMGIPVVRLGKYENEKLTDCLQVTFHHIPLTPFTIGYAPKCPLPTASIFRELRTVGREHHAILIQLEPNSTVEEAAMMQPYPGLIPSHHPLFTKYTFILDLSKPEQEILASFHPKTRYNIRVAERHGVVVTEDNSDTTFAAYLKLSHETTTRQKFYAHSLRYHQTLWKILKEHNIAHLFTATYNNELVCAWMVFVWKNTVYYPYGASSRSHREVMAPNLMLWHIATWAKRQGLFYFDLWGAMGPNPDIKDPWYGFHRFKEGYNPALVEFIGSFDFVLNPLFYRLYKIVDSLRWFLLTHKPFS